MKGMLKGKHGRPPIRKMTRRRKIKSRWNSRKEEAKSPGGQIAVLHEETMLHPKSIRHLVGIYVHDLRGKLQRKIRNPLKDIKNRKEIYDDPQGIR